MSKKEVVEAIAIKPINLHVQLFNVRGTAPLLQARFSKKAEIMLKMQEGGSNSKKTRTGRDYDAEMRAAMHVAEEGWSGIPAAAFRNACIDACRMVGFKMTFAKMSIFVEADGLSRDDGSPLVKLVAGEPELSTMHVKNATGVVDVRARPMWRTWGVALRVRYDADQFKTSDIANLVERAGQQVGVGEGRPYSKGSSGIGMGTFTILG